MRIRVAGSPWIALAAPWVLLAITASACGDTSTRPGPLALDSAGVRVVTNPPGSIEAAEAWSLSPSPIIEIGAGVDPDVALSRVVGIAPLPGSRIVISMIGPPLVLVVDSDGSLAATLGRPGDGPGEFSGVGSAVPFAPDSVAVWDPERRRVSVFTTDGRFLRELDLRELAPLSWLTAPSSSVLSAWTHLLPSGSRHLVLFSVGVFGPGSEPGMQRIRAPSYRITTAGTEPEHIGDFPGEATFVSEVIGAAPYPLGPDGFGTAAGDDFVVGTAESPEIRRYSAGRISQIVRWPDLPRPVDGPLFDLWSEHVDAWLAPMSVQEAGDWRETLEAIPDPEQFPAYGALVGDDQGRAWVGAYLPGQTGLVAGYIGRMKQPQQRWIVFSPGGSLVASVLSPRGFRLLAVREGRAWGVFTDDLDVESVRAYEIFEGRP